MSKIQLGISSCLMGQKVRFDTGAVRHGRPKAEADSPR